MVLSHSHWPLLQRGSFASEVYRSRATAAEAFSGTRGQDGGGVREGGAPFGFVKKGGEKVDQWMTAGCWELWCSSW